MGFSQFCHRGKHKKFLLLFCTTTPAMEDTLFADHIRQRMRQFRIAAGYSQSAMATLLHMDERNYKRIESGERKTLDAGLMEQFCSTLQLPLYSLMLGHEAVVHIHRQIERQWAALRQLAESLQQLEPLLRAPDTASIRLPKRNRPSPRTTKKK